jgi:hypothetical protein
MIPIKRHSAHLFEALLLCACAPTQSEQFNLPGITFDIPDRHINHETMSLSDAPGFDKNGSTIWLTLAGQEIRALIPQMKRHIIEDDMFLHDNRGLDQALQLLIPQTELKAFYEDMSAKSRIPKDDDYKRLVARLSEANRETVEEEFRNREYFDFQIIPNSEISSEKGREDMEGYQAGGISQEGWRKYSKKVASLNARIYLDESEKRELLCQWQDEGHWSDGCHRYLIHGPVVIEYDLHGKHADDARVRVAVDRALMSLVDSWRKP